eukprot:9428188-Karenia_brevis.AAC.1
MHNNFVEAMGLRKGVHVSRAAEYLKEPGATLSGWWDIMFHAKRIPSWQDSLETLGGDSYPVESKDDILDVIKEILNSDLSTM